jgi:hypothetical protein
MDPISSPPIPIAPPVPRRRWWLRGVLIILALAILVPTGIFTYTNYTTRNNWAAAEAEADASDPHWRFQQLLDEQTPIPDQENSALYIIAVASKAKNTRIAGAANYELIFAKLPPNARLNSQQVELLRGQLGAIAKPLEEARKLKDMPRGRFPVKYSDDFIGTLIPNHQDARDLADWLQHDAYDLAHQGKYNEAVESCQACLNAGRSFSDDLFLISHLIRFTAQRISIESLERVLAQGEASDDSLKEMQALLTKEMQESSWLRAIRGERGGVHMLFENIRASKIKDNMLRGLATGKGPANLTEWFHDKFPSSTLKYYPDHLRHMTECVEIAKLPIHEQKAKIDAWDKKGKDSRNPIIQILTPALAKVHQAESRSQATLRTAVVAVTCERFRLERKRWPETLDELVKEKLLDKLPTDPIDGQPLRFRRTKEGVVIYSIGVDGIDNDGHIEHEPIGNFTGLDIGFRLWDVKKRRQTPLPPAAIPE